MADQHAAERIRRLSVIVRAEREIAAATREAYAELLARIAADVLDDVAVVAAVPDTSRNRNQVNAAWLLLLAGVHKSIARLFRARFLGSGARREAIQTAEDSYLAGVDGHLAGVPAEVYKDLDRIVADGIKSGLSEDEIRASVAREITPGHAEYDARLKSVSTRVARTEGTAAFNAGEDAGWTDVARQQGSKLTKRWLSSHDLRVRETHQDADGQVVPADQPFTVGGYPADYPGDWRLPPQESVNCRCTAVYSTDAIVAQGAVMTRPVDRRSDQNPVPDPDLALPDGWRGVMAGLDIETGDGRFLATPEGGVRTREYPLSFTLDHVGDGPAPVIGSVDRVWVQDGLLHGEGKLDLGGDAGAEFARQLTEGYINTVSIHPDQVTAIMQMIDPDGNVVQEPQAVYEANDHAMPEGYRDRMAFTDWRLAGLAAVPIPAYTEARIEGVYNYVPTGPLPGDAIVATVGGQVFTRRFFNFKATGPTKMTITEDGHVYGHVRLRGTCYQYGGGQGDGGYCVEPPMSACGYGKFHAHSARLDDGSTIDCGALTFGEGHESRGGLLASRRHYDQVATMAAKVVASDDEWGVFVTGEVLEAYRDQAYDLLMSPLSGHWEPDADNGGFLEMLAAHIVVTPGYNVRPVVATFDESRQATSIIITTRPNRTETATVAPSARAAVVAAMRDIARAERAAKRIGVDPASRVRRALARINPDA